MRECEHDAAQTNTGDSLQPLRGQLFLVSARYKKKTGQFLIRKHRARSLELWNNLALCTQQWKEITHTPRQEQRNKFNEEAL